MKAYIKNIEGLNEFLGYDSNEFEGEEIGYGEKAVIFNDVTDLCSGDDEYEKFEDFCINADFGQCISYNEKMICKVRNSQGDAENVYEDEDGEIHSL